MKINMDDDGSNKSPKVSSNQKVETNVSPRRLGFVDALRERMASQDTENQSIFKKWWWLFVIIIVVLFIGVKSIFGGSSTDTSKKEVPAKVQKLKPIEKKAVGSTTLKGSNTVDMKPRVAAYLTSYQQFNGNDKNAEKNRIAGMMKYADKSVVQQTLNFNPSLDKALQSGSKLVVKLSQAPDVQQSGTGIYNVTLKYVIAVNGHESKHKDQYTVVTAKDKITQVSQTNVDTE